MPPVPVTVFTGFLGAGKTSIILNLLPQLPKDYRAVLLKNEFGDVAVDSQLAAQGSLAGVSEILNGCMCCVLVGQMKTALLEILDKFTPDRIIIECSGSAFPATLAFQIRELERETNRALALDAIVTVIDAENFAGYEDTSVTAKMQAQYTDLLILNKWESLSERALDDVLEHLNTLNELTPKVRTSARATIDPALVFGLDSRLFLDPATAPAPDAAHHDEVETATVWRGANPAHNHDHKHDHDHTHAHTDAQVATAAPLDEPTLTAALAPLSKETIYRVKGFVLLPGGLRILNWAFGRSELVDCVAGAQEQGALEGVQVRLTVMGERGEVKRAARGLAARLGAKML